MSLNTLKARLGLLTVLCVGVAFLAGTLSGLDLGSLRRMGPGAFPLLVASILVLLACAELVKSVGGSIDWETPNLRSVACVSAGVAAFAFLTPLLGALPGAAFSVLAASQANPDVSWRVRILLSVFVAFGVWAIFIVGLKLPLVPIRGL